MHTWRTGGRQPRGSRRGSCEQRGQQFKESKSPQTLQRLYHPPDLVFLETGKQFILGTPIDQVVNALVDSRLNGTETLGNLANLSHFPSSVVGEPELLELPFLVKLVDGRKEGLGGNRAVGPTKDSRSLSAFTVGSSRPEKRLTSECKTTSPSSVGAPSSWWRATLRCCPEAGRLAEVGTPLLR